MPWPLGPACPPTAPRPHRPYSPAAGRGIAVMLPNIAAFPLAMLGIVRAGGVQVSVNPLYTPRELEHQLNDAGVETIVIFNGGSTTLAEVIGKTAGQQINQRRARR